MVVCWNVGTHLYQSQWNDAMQRPLRRSRSFKVTDFGANRKLIYEFLLVINTTSCLALFTSYGWLLVTFSLARGECLTLTLSWGWSPASIAINDKSLKTEFFGLHFRCRKYWCSFNHLRNFFLSKSKLLTPNMYCWSCKTLVAMYCTYLKVNGIWKSSVAHRKWITERCSFYRMLSVVALPLSANDVTVTSS